LFISKTFYYLYLEIIINHKTKTMKNKVFNFIKNIFSKKKETVNVPQWMADGWNLKKAE